MAEKKNESHKQPSVTIKTGNEAMAECASKLRAAMELDQLERGWARYFSVELEKKPSVNLDGNVVLRCLIQHVQDGVANPDFSAKFFRDPKFLNVIERDLRASGVDIVGSPTFVEDTSVARGGIIKIIVSPKVYDGLSTPNESLEVSDARDAASQGIEFYVADMDSLDYSTDFLTAVVGRIDQSETPIVATRGAILLRNSSVRITYSDPKNNGDAVRRKLMQFGVMCFPSFIGNQVAPQSNEWQVDVPFTVFARKMDTPL